MSFVFILCVSLVAYTSDGSEYSNDFKEDYTYYATKLRADILSGYDKAIPPLSDRSVNYSEAGADIALSVRFFKVKAVDASNGLLDLKVWVRMNWTDQRLSWNPRDYGNITKVPYLAAHWTAAEITEIWLSDIQMYNSAEGTILTLEPTGAIVHSNGDVFWSRPGILKTTCKFSGLVAFPYDKLKCSMEWGGWIFSGGYQGIILTGESPGYAFSDQEATAGTSYQEYSIENVQVEITDVFYDCCPQEPWPLVKYIVTLNRATFYYSLLILAPSCLVTMLSFGALFLSPECGERLSFGITLVLVMEVNKIGVASFLPVCAELLWVEVFMWTCTTFCLISLLETTVVYFFAFHRDETVLPDWIINLRTSLWDRFDGDDGLQEQTSCAGIVYQTRLHEQKSGLQLIGNAEEDDSHRLRYFETLFCELDAKSKMYVTVDQVASLVTFINLELPLEDCLHKLSGKFNKRKTDSGFGRLSRHEFIMFCIEVMSHVSLDEMKIGMENYASVNSQKRRAIVGKFLKISKIVDQWMRFWVPFFYLVTMGFLFNMNFDDDYSEQGSGMFDGFGSISMSFWDRVRASIAPGIGCVCFLGWLKICHKALREKARRRTIVQRKVSGRIMHSSSKPSKHSSSPGDVSDSFGRGAMYAREDFNQSVEDKVLNWLEERECLQKTNEGSQDQRAEDNLYIAQSWINNKKIG